MSADGQRVRRLSPAFRARLAAEAAAYQDSLTAEAESRHAEVMQIVTRRIAGSQLNLAMVEKTLRWRDVA